MEGSRIGTVISTVRDVRDEGAKAAERAEIAR